MLVPVTMPTVESEEIHSEPTTGLRGESVHWRKNDYLVI